MSAFTQACDNLHSALAVFCQKHGCDFSDDMEMAFDADGGFLWAQDDGDYFWTIPDIAKDRVLPDEWGKIVGLAETYFLQ